MAHLEKYPKAGLSHLLKHNERTERDCHVNRSNKNIVPERTHLNYNLAPETGMSMHEVLKKRLSEVRLYNRPDVNVMGDWVITKPKDVKDEDTEKFFKAAYEFCRDRYGEKNVVGAFVHMDECTPHLHFSFVPVVVDKKKHDEKVCFQECCPRRDYQTFHPELSAHIEKALGYQVEILNEATRDGNKEVIELKRETFIREFEREKAEQERIWEEVKARQQRALEEVERKLQAERNDLEVLTREHGVLDEIMRTQFNVPDGVEHYKSFLGGSMVRMPAETFDMMKSRLDAADKIQVVSYFDRNRYRELINLDSYKEIRKATAETEAAKREAADLRREYDAFVERTNKNYSFINSFLEARPEWKKEFLRQREELARSQENRSRNYGREQSRGYER